MKAALITGAGRRIGQAIALDLASAGWQVVLHCHRSRNEAEDLRRRIEAAGGRAALAEGDLASADDIDAVMARAFAVAPALELVVNNASSFMLDDAMTATAEAMHRDFSINAVAPVLIAQRFAARLSPQANGAIVMLLDNRIFAPNPDYFSYGLSKFAALGATRMLALALAPRIRVNGIAPGITLPSGAQTQAEFEAAHRLNPLGRGCSPAEIAAAVRLIAGSPSMTGTIITIDGGLTLANPGRDVAFLPSGAK
jgi:NAD(P)-dependent dehydrogenase (short-subunit alcohol dehydrogenase family)